MACYVRTETSLGIEIHLVASRNDDSAICGMDILGDDEHYAKPVDLEGTSHHVTCHACLKIINAVKEHIKNDTKKPRPPAIGKS